MSDSNNINAKAQIIQLLNKIETQNIKIVGPGVYSSSGHNNARLVSRAVAFAEARLAEIIDTIAQAQLIQVYSEHLYRSQNHFEREYDDPDGAGGGTLTDIINGLKKLL